VPRPAPFSLNRAPRPKGLPLQGGEHMLRTALYVKFVIVMTLLAALSLALGSEPWGPN